MLAPGKGSDNTVKYEQICRTVCDNVAEVLFLEESQIDEYGSFSDIGLDSILGVEFIDAINKRFSLDEKATLLYEFKNVAELTKFIIGREKPSMAELSNSSHQPLGLDKILVMVKNNELSVEDASEFLNGR